MKILIYSDLHLEFAHNWSLPKDIDGDLLVLAGDIITFKDYSPLSQFLEDWNKPVLYVPGNHEYYTQKPMDKDNKAFRAWLTANHPDATLLLDESVTIDGVNFFGGVMWTNFSNANPEAMRTAEHGMNDFRLIRNPDNSFLKPADTINLHDRFVERLLKWFDKKLTGPRIVISHHAPVINPNTRYSNSALSPAFNSLDMVDIIKQNQPDLWIYGHTHECDDQMIGETRVVSNQLGYPQGSNRFECTGFDRFGLQAVV